jgi:hypothetical protein
MVTNKNKSQTMANASVEIGKVVHVPKEGIHGACLVQETLAISGAAATLANAVTAAQVSAGAVVARITTDDTACYAATGTTPDPDAVTSSATTSARRLIPAGGTIELAVYAGDKVAVKAVA